MGAMAFSEKVAEKLEKWKPNEKYGGLKNCTVKDVVNHKKAANPSKDN